MNEEDLEDKFREWIEGFETEQEFVSEIPPTLQGVLDVIFEAAQERGYLTADLFRQVVMFLSYTNCNLATSVLNLNREEYMRLCEISYDAFVNLTATHDTSDRRDH